MQIVNVFVFFVKIIPAHTNSVLFYDILIVIVRGYIHQTAQDRFGDMERQIIVLIIGEVEHLFCEAYASTFTKPDKTKKWVLKR